MNTNTQQKVEQRRKWREEENARIEAVKAEMAETYGLARNAKFDIAWAIAWDHGHSAGMDEVKSYFQELADLLK